ncbi:MAG: translation initiation factor IF-3 [Actinomycetota bacterium]|nr:translation initiation factor IF-3 [Actinomycetota bacterium]
MNERIRAPQVRLVGADGSQIGIVTIQDALERARVSDLDLVEVAPQANPPVCRIMDYGKYKYERGMRQKEARKKQQRIEVKEIKFRPKIDRHDYETKKGHVIRFLNAGARVKVTIMFRGREMAHTELGSRILDRLVEDLDGLANVDQPAKLDGRNMIMVIAPTKKPVTRVKPERPKERGGAIDEGEDTSGDGQALPGHPDGEGPPAEGE